jgi:hypothetical protein
MVSVVLGMLLCVSLALVVVALVAVPARRAGRDVLSERGEDIVGSIRERQLTLARGDRHDPEAPDHGGADLDDLVGARA